MYQLRFEQYEPISSICKLIPQNYLASPKIIAIL